MKYLALILAAFLLTGCEKLRSFPLGGYSQDSAVLVIAGQSNALHFGWWGLRAIQTKYPKLQVINCAVGSSTMNEWDNEGASHFSGCTAQLKGRKPDFVFWMQGENNTFEGDTSQYMEKTVGVFNRFKALNPGLKLVFAQLGPNNSGIDYTNWQTIQSLQASIYLPGVSMVIAKDLQTESDGIHLTPDSVRILGERVAEEL